MSPLRARMIEDMTLAGLAAGTQQVYVQAVCQLAAHYRRSPDQLSEEEVRAYLLGLRQNGAARGTFKISQYGLRFLYHHTLGRGWGLFGKKGSCLPLFLSFFSRPQAPTSSCVNVWELEQPIGHRRGAHGRPGQAR